MIGDVSGIPPEAKDAARAVAESNGEGRSNWHGYVKDAQTALESMLTQDGIIAYLRSILELHGTQRDLAARVGVSEQYLSDILSGRRDVSDEFAQKIGFRRMIRFARIT